VSATATQLSGGAPGALTGRTFLHPAFDYLVIGGGLSLLVAAVVWLEPAVVAAISPTALAVALLAFSMAHFASSTLRLYTIPGARSTWPFLTMGLPLATLAALTLVIWQAEHAGVHLQKLYLTWLPFHYAAQAYHLAVMYADRSGCRLGVADERYLRWASLLPFFWAVLAGPEIGLHWVLPASWLATPAVAGVTRVLFVLSLVAPFAVFARFRVSTQRPLPAICPLLLLSNGIWWLFLPPLAAFVWATIFHGLQYLAIALIFHVRDPRAAGATRTARVARALGFYAVCVVLGYALFRVLPLGYLAAGFGTVESVLLVTAAIHIHHFVVDACIWRRESGGSRRRGAEAVA
jgi:hypothetical protein